MANKLVGPQDQFIVANPYFGSNFEFGDAPDDVRLCRYLNHIFNIYGKDVVIQGGSVSSVSLESDTFSIAFNSGRVIQDKTLIKFEDFTLDMNVSSFDPENIIMFVFTKFKYSETDRNVDTDPNPFTFRLGALDKTDGTIFTESSSGNIIVYNWDSDVNRIVLAAYDLSNINEYLDSIEINGALYYPRGNMDSLINPLNYDGGVIGTEVETIPIDESHIQSEGNYSFLPIQDAFFKPYTQRIYQTRITEYTDGGVETKQARFIDEEFNKINRIIGRDAILKGLDIKNYSNTSSSIEVTIGSGEMITDDTYVQINEDITLKYDNLHVYDENGLILLVSDFENENAIKKNIFRFRLVYLDSNGTSIDNFDINRNRIIFAAFSFSKSGSSISSVNLENDNLENININGTWKHKFETEFEDDGVTEKRFLDRIFLANTSYNFSFDSKNFDSSDDGFLRFKSDNYTLDATGNLTVGDTWTNQSGNISIPEINYYNLIIYGKNAAQMKNFEISGKFPYKVRPFGDFEAELDGDFIL